MWEEGCIRTQVRRCFGHVRALQNSSFLQSFVFPDPKGTAGIKVSKKLIPVLDCPSVFMWNGIDHLVPRGLCIE